MERVEWGGGEGEEGEEEEGKGEGYWFDVERGSSKVGEGK